MNKFNKVLIWTIFKRVPKNPNASGCIKSSTIHISYSKKKWMWNILHSLHIDFCKHYLSATKKQQQQWCTKS